MLSVEELLIDRYKVIAPDTSGGLNVGDIYYKRFFETSETGMYTYVTNLNSPLQGNSKRKEHVEAMPHLFQRLEWWQDRKVEDMPMFIKFADKDIVYKISNWEPSISGWHMKNETDGTGITEGFASIDWHFKKDTCIPATEADYNAWKKEGENE